MQMPTPGAEHRRLISALAGDWTSEETLFPMAWSPDVQHRRGRTRNREAMGGLFLVNDYEQLDEGRVVFQGHGVYGWDPEAGGYTMDWFDSMSFRHVGPVPGAWEGDTLRFETAGKARYEYVVQGADLYVFRMAIWQNGGWHPMMEGIFRRS
jgi:hypothetical protein